ncbi:MAG: alpha/beta hydrolase family protein [Acidimicrobiales bacterium]
MAVVALVIAVAGCSSSDPEPSNSTDPSTAPPTSLADTAAPTTSSPPSSAAPATTTGIVGVKLDQPGPMAVGVTTISLGDRDAEVWYPVEPGDTEGLENDSYSTLEILPEDLQELLADIDTPVETDAYRDAPSAAEGPYPLMIYSHGAAGYRKVATFNNTHLASWGFVVASIDHLERGLLASNGLLDLPERDGGDVEDVMTTIDMLVSADDPLLGGLVDGEQVAIMGHSAGGFTAVRAAQADDRIDTFISWASAGDPESADLPTIPTQFVAADGDIAIAPSETQAFYDALEGPRQMVVLDNAGHNSFTDACEPIYEIGGLSQVAEALGLPQNLVALGEDGCVPDAGFTEPTEFFALLNHLTLSHVAAVFELDIDADPLDPAVTELYPGLIESFDTAP